jgi:signal transduction histidine kinase
MASRERQDSKENRAAHDGAVHDGAVHERVDSDPSNTGPFAGEGEVRTLARALDWGATPLGPSAGWSHSLRTTAAVVVAAPVGMILLWGPDLVQIYNDPYAAIMGAKHPGGLGQRNRDCWPEAWDFTGPIYDDVLTRGRSFVFRDQRLMLERHGAPEETFFTLSYSPVPDDDRRVGGILVTVAETTAEVAGRAAEAERARLALALEAERASVLEAAFRIAPSFLAIYHGPRHVFALANEAYYGLIGYGRDILGKPLLEALPEVRGQGFDVLLDRVLATGEPFVATEIPVRLQRTPGGPTEDRVVALTYLPLVAADDTRTGVVAHGTDVTEYVEARRELERLLERNDAARRAELEVANEQLRDQARELELSNQQLQEQAVELEAQSEELQTTAAELEERQAEAEAANLAKTQFLTVMSHELRTPLNAIGGYAELLSLGLRGPVTEAQQEDLQRLRRANRHLIGLIADVLSFARIEGGQLEYHTEAFELAPVVADVEALAAPQLGAKRLTFSHDGCASDTPETPHRLWADQEKTRQILANVLTNAVKFTDVGGRIEMRCDTDVAAGVVRIRVTDTGRGIAGDQLARVFEPFVQVDRHLTHDSQQGVGLGLAISRDLARGMGGDLTAESTPGAGSTFTLRLPLDGGGGAAPATPSG